MLSVNASGIICDLNPLAEEILGWTAVDAVGQALGEVFHIVDGHTQQPVAIFTKQLLATGAAVQSLGTLVLQTRSGSCASINCNAVPLRDKNGKLACISLVFRDITDEEKAERTLKHLAAIIESSSNAIISTTLDNIVTSWNPGAERIFGYSSKEMIGSSMVRLYPADHLAEEARMLAYMKSDKRISNFETIRLTKGGNRIPVSLTISPIKDDDGQIVGLSKILIDLTNQRQAEERQQSVLRSAIDGFLIVDNRTLRILEVNDAYSKMSGYSREELLSMRLSDIEAAMSLPELEELLSEIKKKGYARFETKNHRKHGKTMDVDISVEYSTIGEGRWLAFVHDITDRRQMEVTLRKSEGLMRSVIDSMPDHIAVLDRHGTMLAVNNAWKRVIYNHSSCTMLQSGRVGTNYLEVCARAAKQLGDQGLYVVNGIREVLAGLRETFEYNYSCSSATGQRWFSMNVSPLARLEGGAVVVHTNKTEQILAEQVLADFKSAFDQHAIVAITDPRGKITYVNDLFCAISKYSREELIGKDHRIINSGYHPKAFIRELWQTIQAGKVWKGALKNRAKDGFYYWVDTTIVPFLDNSGKPTQYIAIRADITARKQAEEQLQISNRQLHRARAEADAANQAKSRFLANLSHEIRTPMNAILGYSQLTLRNPHIDRNTEENLKIINRSGEHLLSLINQVLDMSKIEAGRKELHPTTFSISLLLNDISSMFRLRAEAKALAFEVSLKCNSVPFIVADEGMLRQILINLLGNAIKFTEVGHIYLQVILEPRSNGQLWLLAYVEDTGVGISDEELQRLFQPFTQAHAGLNLQEGTGLGLAISREYARLMNGDLSVKSHLGKGSLFELKIPVQRGESLLAARPIGAHSIQGLRAGQDPPRILVVDDQFENRDWLVKLLEELGFLAQGAENGATALQQWEQWKPHLILMDIHMPTMDGLEATRRIKESPRGKETVIIALTASIMDNERLAALQSGVDDFLTKPCDENELLDKLQNHLDVVYDYRDDKAVAPPQAAEGAILRAEMFRELPQELLNQLRDATLMGDKRLIEELILAIRENGHGEASDALQKLVNCYEYDRIVGILEEVCR